MTEGGLLALTTVYGPDLDAVYPNGLVRDRSLLPAKEVT